MVKENHDFRRKTDRLLIVLALAVFTALLPLKGAIPRKIELRPEVLVFTHWWGDELEGDVLESIVREFEGLNPGIRVRLAGLPYGELRDRLFTPETAEEPPPWTDVVALDPRWLEDLEKARLLADPASRDQASQDQASRDQASRDPAGQTAAVPLLSFMTVFFYNIDVLEEAGFNRPPKTHSEFLEVSRALAAKGRFGLGLALSPENLGGIYRDLFPWFWASGVHLMRGGKPGFSGRAVTGVLEFFAGLHREGLIPADSFSKTAEQKREEFAAGKIGMMTGSIQDIGPLRRRMGSGRFGITAIPGPDLFTGKTAFGLSSWYAGIFAGSRRQEESRAFVSFLAEKAPLLAAAAHAVPGPEPPPLDAAAHAVPGNSPGPYITADPLYSKAWDLYEGGETIREFDGLPRFRDLEARFRLEFIGLFEGSQTPAETAQEIQQGWELILEP